MLQLTKKIGRVFQIALMIFTLGLMVYATAYAGINKILGGNITNGWGLLLIADGDADTMKVNATALADSLLAVWDLDQTVYGIITFNQAPVLPAGSIGAAEIAADAVGDDEIDYANVTLNDFDYQTAWRIFYSNTDGDVTELAFGTSGQYLKSNGATSAPTWDTPGGAGDMLKSVYDSDIDNDINPSAGGLGADISTWNGVLAIQGGVASACSTKAQLETQIDDVSDFAEADGDIYSGTHDFSSATVNLPTGAVDAAGEIADDIITAALFANGDWGDMSVATNSITLDADVVDSTNVPATGLSESDIKWRTELWGGSQFSIRIGVDDSLNILYPVGYDSVQWCVLHWNSSAQNDQLDTVIFSGRLPIGLGTNGIDSVTFRGKTTGSATTDASIEVKCFKQTAGSWTLTALSGNLAAFNSSGAWQAKTISSFSTNASGGDFVIIYMINKADANDSTWHDQPYVWYDGK